MLPSPAAEYQLIVQLQANQRRQQPNRTLALYLVNYSAPDSQSASEPVTLLLMEHDSVSTHQLQ